MRLWPRTNVTSERVEVISGVERIVGWICDESFGGLGIEFDEVPSIVAAQELSILRNGEFLAVTVRHVSAGTDGKCRVGFRWKPVGLSFRGDYRHPTTSEDSTKEFFDELPGGLYRLTRFFEERRWSDIIVGTNLLDAQAQHAGFGPELQPLTSALRRTLVDPTPKQVGKALMDLMQACKTLVPDSAEQRQPEPVGS